MKSFKLRYYLLLGIFSPMIMAFAAILNFNQKIARGILILFSGIFGGFMLFLLGQDGERHGANVAIHYDKLSFGAFLNETSNILLLQGAEGAKGDIYIHALSFIVSRFTTDPRLLFLLVGLIFGFFYIKGIGRIYDMVKPLKGWLIFVLFTFFIFWKGLEGINTVRTWTGAWIYFYGATSYFITRKNKYIWLVLCTPFVHFVYLLYILPFLGYLVLGNRPRVYLSILILSFFLQGSGLIQNSIGLIGPETDFAQRKVSLYAKTDEESMQEYQDKKDERLKSANFLKSNYNDFTQISITILFCYILYRTRYYTSKLKKQDYLAGLLGAGTLMLSLGNLFSFIPAARNRMMILFGIFAIASIILVLNRKDFQLKTVTDYFLEKSFLVLLVLSTLFVTLFKISEISELEDIRILLPLFTYLFFDNAYSIKEFIK